MPGHLKDAHYKDAKAEYGYGINYKYPRDYPNHESDHECLPASLKR